MSKIDVQAVKDKIVDFLSSKGPNLPLQISRHIGIEPMFTSAILSELLSQKKIKTSSMKVGTSPLYLLPGQEEKLEEFAENLEGVEKEAYLLIKNNKVVEDSLQEPRMRVALRGLKDFAIPTHVNNKIYWKYFTVSNEKLREAMEDEGEVVVGERVVGQQIWEDIKKEKNIEEITDEKLDETHKKILTILSEETKKREQKTEENTSETFQETNPKKERLLDLEKSNTQKEIVPILTKPLETKVVLKKPKKITEKDIFLENSKKVLEQKNIEIIEVLQYDKKQIMAKARIDVDKTCILYYLDKKKPDEKDILKAYRKSREFNIPYYVLTQSGPTKKLKETAEIYQSLIGLGSIE